MQFKIFETIVRLGNLFKNKIFLFHSNSSIQYHIATFELFIIICYHHNCNISHIAPRYINKVNQTHRTNHNTVWQITTKTASSNHTIHFHSRNLSDLKWIKKKKLIYIKIIEQDQIYRNKLFKKTQIYLTKIYKC